MSKTANAKKGASDKGTKPSFYAPRFDGPSVSGGESWSVFDTLSDVSTAFFVCGSRDSAQAKADEFNASGVPWLAKGYSPFK